MKRIILTAFALCTLNLAAQTEVSTYEPGITEEGITYFLPTTHLQVVVTATRKSYAPGEYAAYARRYLRTNDAVQTPYDEWFITDVSLIPYGVADKQQGYTIKLKSKTSAPLVGMAPDGRLLSINTEAPALPALTKPSVVREKTERPNPADYKTEEILSAGSTAKMAELTAAEIYDIRENRSALTKGQADFMPKDGEQLRLMLASLDTQEAALLQLFKGTTSTETHVFVFDYVPTDGRTQDVLFRFSKYFGPVDSDDPAGEPFYINVRRDDTAAPAAPADGKKSKKEEQDLRYVVPGNATVSITSGKRQYASATLPLAQFGRIEHLGGDLFNKKYTTRVTLSPSTGGILRIDADIPE